MADWENVEVEIVDEVDREYHFEPDEHEQVWMDRPDDDPAPEIVCNGRDCGGQPHE